MKKVLLIAVIFAAVLSGCSAKYSIRHEFPRTYEYDRLYSAALLAMNDTNYIITEHSKPDGIVTGKDMKNMYFDWNAGVFIVLPWACAIEQHPVVSIVLVKEKEKTLLSAGQVTGSAMKSALADIMDKLEYFYSRFDAADKPAGENEKSTAAVGKPQDTSPAVTAEAVKEAVVMKAGVAWDNGRGLTVHNSGADSWKDLVISLEYSSILENRTFTYSAGAIGAGGSVTVKKSMFRDENNGEIKRNDRPGKISLKCAFDNGNEGRFESK